MEVVHRLVSLTFFFFRCCCCCSKKSGSLFFCFFVMSDRKESLGCCHPPGGLQIVSDDDVTPSISLKWNDSKEIKETKETKERAPQCYVLNKQFSMCSLSSDVLVRNGYYQRHVKYIGSNKDDPDTRIKYQVTGVKNAQEAGHLIRSMVAYETSDYASIEWWHCNAEEHVVYDIYLWDKATEGSWSVGKKAENHTFQFLKQPIV